MTKGNEMLGWHFSTGVLGHGDGRTIKTGLTHHVDGPLAMCRRGLHASARAIDALEYSPRVSAGLYVARVRLHGDILHGNDKSVATDRTCLWVAQADLLLHEFACECAESALMIGQVNDERCWNAIAVKREWMAGNATQEQLAAATAAAWAVAWAAATAAAWDAAWDAATAAAWDAAWAAAWAAARDAAWAAVWAAARDAENDLLESLLDRIKPRSAR